MPPTFFPIETTFEVAATGDTVDIIQVTWGETTAENYEPHTKVLVMLHDMNDGNQKAADRLTQFNYYGETIEGVKVLFPNSPFDDHPMLSSQIWDYWFDGLYTELALGIDQNSHCNDI